MSFLLLHQLRVAGEEGIDGGDGPAIFTLPQTLCTTKMTTTLHHQPPSIFEYIPPRGIACPQPPHLVQHLAGVVAEGIFKFGNMRLAPRHTSRRPLQPFEGVKGFVGHVFSYTGKSSRYPPTSMPSRSSCEATRSSWLARFHVITSDTVTFFTLTSWPLDSHSSSVILPTTQICSPLTKPSSRLHIFSQTVQSQNCALLSQFPPAVLTPKLSAIVKLQICLPLGKVLCSGSLVKLPLIVITFAIR
jgi:hypothetical protein